MRVTRRTLGTYLTASAIASAVSPIAASQQALREKLYIRRYAPALATDGKSVFISGGAPIGAGRTDAHTYSSVMSIVEAIDPTSLGQTFLANALLPRANHASVWVDGKLWLLGGRTQLGDERRLASEVERIDVETQAIWRGPDLPVALIDLAAVVIGRSVFVFGGIYRDTEAGQSKPSNRVFECAPPYGEWIEREAMPEAIGNMPAIAVGGKAFLIGGFDRQKAHAITQIFDPATNSWALGPPPPRPLSAHAGAGSASHIFVFGDYQEQSSVLGLHIRSGEWRTLNIPFMPRRHVRAVRVGDKIIVAGGNQSSLAPATDAIEAFSLDFLHRVFADAA